MEETSDSSCFYFKTISVVSSIHQVVPPIHYVMGPLHSYNRKHQNQIKYHSFRKNFLHLNSRRQSLDAPLCILPAQDLLINKPYLLGDEFSPKP